MSYCAVLCWSISRRSRLAVGSWRCHYDCKPLAFVPVTLTNKLTYLYTRQVTCKTQYYVIFHFDYYSTFPLSLLFIHNASTGIDRLWWPEWCVFRECCIQHRLGTSGQNTRQLTVAVCQFGYYHVFVFIQVQVQGFTCNNIAYAQLGCCLCSIRIRAPPPLVLFVMLSANLCRRHQKKPRHAICKHLFVV